VDSPGALVAGLAVVSALAVMMWWRTRRQDRPRSAGYSADERAQLAAQARSLAATLDEIFSHVEPMFTPGVATREIDERVAKLIEAAGVRSSFLGYHEYPSHSITSLNEEVADGLPSDRLLSDGDLLKLEIGIAGSDTYAIRAWTDRVGRRRHEDDALLKAARQALTNAIPHARIGARTGDISSVIQETVEAAGFNVDRNHVGFGIGRLPHDDPPIPCFGKPGYGARLVRNQLLSIYVIALAGSVETVQEGWTAKTSDGGRAVSFSHMIVVGADGPDILTADRQETSAGHA
jgi:methionyl aminopeptidase